MTSSNEQGVPSQRRPVSVLFVCLGNICRSPMAEAVFRRLTGLDTSAQHPLIARVDSCGTGAYHAGNQPDPRALAVLERNGISGFRHEARRIREPEDIQQFDYVVAMDAANLDDLKDMVKRAEDRRQLDTRAARVRLYGVFGGQRADEEIDDPYYGGPNGFQKAYEQLMRFAEGLLKHIENEDRLVREGMSS